MISDLYLISEKDKNKYLDLAEKQITQFSKELPEITILFQSLCINVPITTYANFRDALFHFLKMRSLGDEIQILQEIYAMEEHLHRSLKDTVISLFQHLTVKLEYLMNIKPFDNNDLYSKMNEETKKAIDLYKGKSIEEIEFNQQDVTYNRSDKIEILATIMLYRYNRYRNESYVNEYRKIIHKVKNECLKIRSVSLSIERPIGNQKSVNYYCAFYNKIINILKNMQVFEYLPFAYLMYKIYIGHFEKT